MGDIEDLKALVAQMATDNARLIAALSAHPGAGHGGPPDAAQLRAEK